MTYNATTRTVTLNPNANLAQSTVYRLNLIGTGVNGIRDTAGTRLADRTISFTTADTTRPTVTAISPANNATGVIRTANVVVTFSEPVLGASGTSVVLRRVSNNTVVASAVTVAGNQVTLNPNATLAGNNLYRLTLTGGAGAIRDAAGNTLVTTTRQFTTRP